MTEIQNRKNGYYYLSNDRKYPSVTAILQVINKPALMYWGAKISAQAMKDNPELEVLEAVNKIKETSKETTDRGSEVHRYIAGEIAEVKPELQGYVNAYKAWTEKEKPKVIAREITVASDEYEYAGTADMLYLDRYKKSWVVDFKTGGIYPEASLQLAAYRHALQESDQEIQWHTGIVQLKPDGNYEFRETNGDFKVFLAAKTLWEWLREEEAEA